MFSLPFSPDLSTWSPERRGLVSETKLPSLFYFISGRVMEAEGLKGKLGRVYVVPLVI